MMGVPGGREMAQTYQGVRLNGWRTFKTCDRRERTGN